MRGKEIQLCNAGRSVTKLGKGSFASVYLVKYREDGIRKKVVLRISDKNEQLEEEEVTSMLTGKVELENVVKIFDNFNIQHNKLLLSVQSLEHCEHGNLFDLVCKGYNLTAKNMFEIINGVKELHDLNIAHRDLKLENILVTASGVCKIADFGLSENCEKPNDLRRCGSPIYSAPELLLGKPFYRKSTDIWSLGVLFCVAFTKDDLFFRTTKRFNQESVDNYVKNMKPKNLSLKTREFVLYMLTVDYMKRPNINDVLEKAEKLWLKEIQRSLPPVPPVLATPASAEPAVVGESSETPTRQSVEKIRQEPAVAGESREAPTRQSREEKKEELSIVPYNYFHREAPIEQPSKDKKEELSIVPYHYYRDAKKKINPAAPCTIDL